jgi:hypothetical protein
MVEGFSLLADALSDFDGLRGWRFRVSPGVIPSRDETRFSSAVERMSFLDEPWDLLCEVKALAVLTPLGFGFKTTILDALAAGCHVLVHPALIKRLPDLVRKHCIEFDPDAMKCTDEIGARLLAAPKRHDVNREMREHALRGLNRAFTT